MNPDGALPFLNWLISGDAMIGVNFLKANTDSDWPPKGMQLQCCFCFIRSKDKCTSYPYEECGIGLCTIMSFRDCCTKVNRWGEYVDVGQPVGFSMQTVNNMLLPKFLAYNKLWKWNSSSAIICILLCFLFYVFITNSLEKFIFLEKERQF